jgi:hypothetical protein
MLFYVQFKLSTKGRRSWEGKTEWLYNFVVSRIAVQKFPRPAITAEIFLAALSLEVNARYFPNSKSLINDSHVVDRFMYTKLCTQTMYKYVLYIALLHASS